MLTQRHSCRSKLGSRTRLALPKEIRERAPWLAQSELAVEHKTIAPTDLPKKPGPFRRIDLLPWSEIKEPLQKLQQQIADDPSYSLEKRDALLSAVADRYKSARVDPQGRVTFSQDTLNFAGLDEETDVVLIARSGCVEVWHHEVFDSYLRCYEDDLPNLETVQGSLNLSHLQTMKRMSGDQ